MKTTLLLIFFIISVFVAKAQIIGDSVPCYGTQNVYSLSNGSGFLFWSVTGNNLTQNLTNGNLLVQWIHTGSYTITCVYTDPINPNKADTATKVIVVEPQPNPLISVLNSQSACEYQSPQTGEGPNITPVREGGRTQTVTCYSVCDSGWYKYSVKGMAGSSFFWHTPNIHNIISTNIPGDTANVDWAAPLPAQYTNLEPTELTVVEVSDKGCRDSNSICISVNGKPHACFTSIPADSSGVVRVCEGATVTFNDSCTWIPQWVAHPSTINERIWILGDGTVVTNQNIVTHQYTAPGNYQVYYIAQSNCYCADTFSMIVHVDAAIGPQIECISTVCHNTWTAYYVNDTCSHHFYWTVTGADSIRASNDSLYVLWGDCNNGYGTISVETDCPSYCPYQSTIIVPVIPANATIVGPGVVCLGDNAVYSTPFVPGTAYEWFGPSTTAGSYPPIINSDSAVHFFRNFGIGLISLPEPIYIAVAYTNQFLGCSGFSTDQVIVAAGLKINYVNGDSIVCKGDSLILNSINYVYNTPVNCNWSVYSLTGNTRADTISNTASYVSTTLAPGSYIVYAYPVTGIYCNVPVSTIVNVLPSPPPVTNPVIGSDTVCPNILFTYYCASSDPTQYYLQWVPVRGTPGIGSGNQFSVAWSAPLPDTLYIRQVMLNEPGCASTPVYYPVYPNINQHPVITGDTNVCSDAITMYATTFSADQYNWTISPGTAGSIKSGGGSNNITIQWNHFTTNTTAQLMLIANKCGYPDTSILNILIQPPPAPTIVVSPAAPYCTGKTITFSTSASGSGYQWDFGDGASSNTGSSVAHTYNNDSAYTIRLVVSNISQCPLNGTAFTTINIFPSPAAYLSTPQILNHCGDAAGWSNTLYATLQNMSNLGFSYQFYYNYASVVSSGSTYTATKTGDYYAVVTTTAGCSSNTDTLTIDSICPIPGGCSTPYTIGFTNSVYCDSVVFTARTDSHNSFTSWNFGDQSSGANNYSSSNPAYHLYSKAGYYHAIVYGTATNSSGTGTCSVDSQGTITVPLVANFLVQFQCQSGVMHTMLTDISTYLSAITSWTWNVNGTYYNTQNVDAIISAGTKNITLTISDGTHSCSISQIVTIPSPPVANFAYQDSQCITKPINLHPLDTTGIVSYLWDFGDGSFSALQNTSKVYDNCPTSGFGGTGMCHNLVTLTETDKYGCTDSVSIIVHYFPDQFNGHSITFSSDVIEACANAALPLVATIQLSMNSLSGDTFAWNNGYKRIANDTQYVDQTGSYSVTVTDDKGCSLFSNNSTSVIFNNIQGFITGDTMYCYNEYSNLNMFDGFQYQYYWLYQINNYTGYTYSTTPSNHGYLFSKLVNNNASTYKVWGVIRDTLPGGSFCEDTLGPITLHMHPVRIYSVGEQDECVAQGSATFTPVGNWSGYTVLWNTGLVGDTLVTSIPGLYTAEFIDSSGCIQPYAAIFRAVGGPDLSQLITGCYSFCLGDTPRLYVPPDVAQDGSVGIQWLYNGYPLSSTYTFDALDDIYALQAGSYQLALINNNLGCGDTSQPISISFHSCSDSCFKHTSVYCSNCYYDSTTHQRYINLLLSISDTIATGGAITVQSQNLGGLNFWPGSLLPGNGITQYINIQGVADSTSNGQYCLQLTFNGCHQVFCVNAQSMSCTGVATKQRPVVAQRGKTPNRNRNTFKNQTPLRYD